MKAHPSWIAILLALIPVSSYSDDELRVIVGVVPAVRSDSQLDELKLTGTIVSQRRARLSSRATGLVTDVLVDAGEHVEKGDTLLSLDTDLAEIDLDLIRAEIESAEVMLAEADRESREVENLTRTGAFAKTEAASRAAMVGVRTAELKALRAREALQKERIARHQLTAPFSGAIAEKYSEVGEWVETGTPVLELIDTDALWFEVEVAQEYAGAIEAVEEAAIRLDAYREEPLIAQIDAIVPVNNPISRTFLTRLTFRNPESRAVAGMSGTALFRLQSDEAASVSIPRDAVTRYPDGSTKVWVVREEQSGLVARSVDVAIPGALGETVEIESGLESGDLVVVRGNEALEEGQAVDARVNEPISRPGTP